MRVISDLQKIKHPPKQRKKIPLKTIFISGGIFLILAGAVYGLFFAGLFDVRAVKYSVPEKMMTADLSQFVSDWLNVGVFGIKRQDNYLMFSLKKLAANLKFNMLAANNVTVTRQGHELLVAIEDRKPAGIWCFSKSEECRYFDENGIGYEKIGRAQGMIYTVISDERNRIVELGSEVESKPWRDKIFLARDILRRNGFEPVEFIFPAGAVDEFDVRTRPTGTDGAKSWRLKLGIQTDIGSQLAAFVSLYNKKMTLEEKDKLEYADLRIPDRIYYK